LRRILQELSRHARRRRTRILFPRIPHLIGIFHGFPAPDAAELPFPGRISSWRGRAPGIAARISKQNVETEVGVMLSWVVTFLIIALIAGILGFGGVAGASIEIAKVIFFIAVVLFLVSAVVGLTRGRTRV
jgi:uncharacterized membrane protein YtjA (UPF0391 family)